MPPTLRRGSRGPHVRHCQSLLANILQLGDRFVDGIFGRITESAVVRYQRQEGLKPTGIVDGQTWARLLSWEEQHTQTVTFSEEEALVVRVTLEHPDDPPWLKVAFREFRQGVREIRGARHNSRIVAYHASTSLRANSDETPWCSSFVNWCVEQAGYQGTKSAAAISWYNSRNQKFLATLNTPVRGCICVIHNAAARRNSGFTSSGNHVGFLLKETPRHYEMLGGNQSNMVRISRFGKTRWKLVGYFWPVHNLKTGKYEAPPGGRNP